MGTFADAFGMAQRREWLNRTVHCPACGLTQVQLRWWFAKPAEWKCRMCNAEFTYEPKDDPRNG